MPSSTFSSEPVLPDGPWGRTFALAAVLALVALGGLEAFWRARGHVPSVTDDMDLWSYWREAARGAGRKTVVVLGMSRMQLAFVPSVFREHCPGYRVADLCLAGVPPLAALRDLAEDESFGGIVLCSVTEAAFHPQVADSQQPYVDYFHSQWSLNKKVNRVLRTAFQERSVLAHYNLALYRVGIELLAHGSLPTPYYVVTHADRSRSADPAKRRKTAVAEAAEDTGEAKTKEAETPAPKAGLHPFWLAPDRWQARVREVDAMVKRIQARGGEVVFVRPISGGDFKEREDWSFPRAQYWDTLPRLTSAVTIHYADVPGMRDLPLFDNVHLDERHAVEFTALLAEELARRGVVRMAGIQGRPRVLLIGDSIALGYSALVRERLEGKAQVECFCSKGTRFGLEHLDRWLQKGPWDAIHFNWGIHDLKGQPPVTPIDAYERNLRELVEKLKGAGASLIWASTTPFYPETDRFNAVARKVMDEEGIPINDLHAAVLAAGRPLQAPHDCHFTPEGYRVLADRVAAALATRLNAGPRKMSRSQ